MQENHILEKKLQEENEALKIELNSYRNDIKSIVLKKMDLFFTKKINLLEITNDYLNKKYPKYIGINYELINKRNLSVPMKKARYEVLKKIENKINLTEEYALWDKRWRKKLILKFFLL